MANERVPGYNVVFKGIGGKDSNFPGIITWTDFGTREKFEEFRKQGKNKDIVLAQGVSDAEAVDFVHETRPAHRILAAVAESVIDGNIDTNLLKFHLRNAAIASGERITAYDFLLEGLNVDDEEGLE